MKKILLSLSICTCFWFFSCKEIGPSIDLSPIKPSDTTYVTAPESATPRHVIVEEYTGVKCVNCPEGAAILKAAAEANDGRVIVIGLHSGSLTSPIDGESKYDFRTQQAKDLMTSFFGEDPPKPAASIDRIKINSSYFMAKGLWQTTISDRLAIASKQNITITSSYNNNTKEAIIKVRVAYTALEELPQKLMVALVESKIIDVQEFPTYNEPNYEHNHVLRDFLTPVSGSSILDTVTKSPGRVYERTFIYPVNESWKPENCQVIAFVFNNDGQNIEVTQAAEANLK